MIRIIDMKTKSSKRAETGSSERSLSILRAPWLLAYRYLGVRIQRNLHYFEDVRGSLQKAALKISLQSYVSMIVLLSGLSLAGAFAVTGVLAAFSGSAIWLALLYATGVGLLFGAVVFGILYGLPAFLAMSRRRKMDLELPYVASHLSILAAAGQGAAHAASHAVARQGGRPT